LLTKKNTHLKARTAQPNVIRRGVCHRYGEWRYLACEGH
jgi:hypothetical protein